MVSEDSIRGGLQQHIGDLIGESAANGLFHLIDQWRSAGSPVVNELVALGVFIIGALRVMNQLQDALLRAVVVAVSADHRGSPVRPTRDAVAVRSASEGDAITER
jgi:hypothetical protein